MSEHDYITVGSRRWCRGCNTYQVFRNGRWRDAFPPAPWPGYEATQMECAQVRWSGGMSQRTFRIILAGMVVVSLAVTLISGCEGEPPHCPPPIGCAR